MGHTTNRREFMRLGAMAAGFGDVHAGSAHQRGRMPIAHCTATLERSRDPGAPPRALADAGPDCLDRAAQGPRGLSRPRPVTRRRGGARRRSSRGARDRMAHPDETRRAVLHRQGCARPRVAGRWRVPRELQLQMAGAAVLGAGRERRNRRPRSARQDRAASRSASSSAASPGATSPSTAPAATAATRRRRRSHTCGAWSKKPAPRRSSSASAHACGSTTPRHGGTWR